MALLTAEDVLNKAFQKTRYREGFDQDEVDEFLDEVADTIAALTAERDELQRRLAAGGGAPATGSTPQPMPESSLVAAATDPNPPSATTMLAMAQKLHDDYVQAGEAERERIMDEARAKAEAIVERAEKDARDRMGSLESERAELERSIDDLRRFERDYRGHLRNYLENLLGDLEHSASKGASAPTTASATPTEAEPMQAPTQAQAPAPESAPEEQARRAVEDAPSQSENVWQQVTSEPSQPETSWQQEPAQPENVWQQAVPEQDNGGAASEQQPVFPPSQAPVQGAPASFPAGGSTFPPAGPFGQPGVAAPEQADNAPQPSEPQGDDTRSGETPRWNF